MFKSNEELFQATNELIAALEKNRNSLAAEELRNGMRALNGLTDGWAAFLKSIQKVQKQYSRYHKVHNRHLYLHYLERQKNLFHNHHFQNIRNEQSQHRYKMVSILEQSFCIDLHYC